MKWNNKYSFAASMFVGIALLTVFQNCGKEGGFKAAKVGFTKVSSVNPVTPDPIPDPIPDPNPTSSLDFGVMDPNCLTNAAYDACLYWKNPVAQANATMDPNNVMAFLTQQQIFGVKIENTDGSGYLRNAAFTILGPSGAALDMLAMRSGSWKYTVAENSSKNLAQVSSYFWFDKATKYYESFPIATQAYIRGQNFKVYSYVPTVTDSTTNQSIPNNNAFFSPPQAGTSLTGIFLGVGLQNMPHAYSADITTHEYSHANLYYGSGGSSVYITSTYANCLEAYKSQISTADYQKFEAKCCATQDGCMRAIDEAIADFHASVMFQTKPVVGEAYMNTLTGLTTCGTRNTIYRDVTKNKNLTPASVFNNCTIGTSSGGSVPLPGEQYTLSAVYSSILWEIRTNMKATVPKFTYQGKSVDGAALFGLILFEAEASFSGSDTFSSTRAKLGSAASAVQSQFGVTTNLTNIINAEFTRRGIN